MRSFTRARFLAFLFLEAFLVTAIADVDAAVPGQTAFAFELLSGLHAVLVAAVTSVEAGFVHLTETASSRAQRAEDQQVDGDHLQLHRQHVHNNDHWAVELTLRWSCVGQS